MSLYRRLVSGRLTLPLIQLLRTQSTIPLNKQTSESSEVEVRPFKDIPGPKGLPYVGSIHRYMSGEGFSKMHKIVMQMFDEFGPVFKENLVGQIMVQVLNPEDIEKVFRTEGKYPYRIPLNSLMDYNKAKDQHLFQLLNTQGEEWRRVRQALAPKMMRPREIYDNIDTFNGVVDDALKSIRKARGEGTTEGEIPNLRDELSKWATESIGTLVFDARVGLYEDPPTEDAQRFIEAVHDFFQYTHNLEVGLEGKVNKLFTTPSWKKLCQALDDILKHGQKFVDAKIKELDEDLKDPENILRSKKGVPLLTYLLAKQDLTPAEINAAAVDIFAAGVDTTSIVLYWALYNLARFPEVQERLYEEIVSVVGEGGYLTARDMGKIPYTKAFLKESMRMNPIVVNNARVLSEDVILGGYNVPAGTIILPSIFAASRAHFEDPEEFKPERWLRKTGDHSHAFSFLPFGFGARMCIGKRVAELEVYLFLSKAVQQFRLESNDNSPPEHTMKLILVPERNLKINFIDRK